MWKATFCLALCAWIAAPAAMVWAQEPIIEAQPFDPLRANKDIEVGTFYFKKGNYDAAIERFEEATRLQPGLALSYYKLGETYEKMKDFPKAAESFRKYLEVYRTAPDGKKVRKRIEGLEKRNARQKEAPSKG